MGNTTTKVPYETLRFHLGEWDLDLFLVKTPNMKDPKECWFSMRPICDKMGLDPTRQYDRIRADPRFAGYWHELPVKTDAGNRESLCLRIEKIGLWFIIISPLKINNRYRGKLEALQADIERKAATAILGEAAAHLLLPAPVGGEGGSATVVHVARAAITLHGEIDIICDCGRVLARCWLGSLSWHGEIDLLCECGQAKHLTFDGDDVTITSGHEV